MWKFNFQRNINFEIDMKMKINDWKIRFKELVGKQNHWKMYRSVDLCNKFALLASNQHCVLDTRPRLFDRCYVFWLQPTEFHYSLYKSNQNYALFDLFLRLRIPFKQNFQFFRNNFDENFDFFRKRNEIMYPPYWNNQMEKNKFSLTIDVFAVE